LTACRVLAVDEDPSFPGRLRAALAHAAFAVEADCPDLRVAAARAAAGPVPDILLADAGAVFGPDGREHLAALRALAPGLSVAVVADRTDTRTAAQALALAADGVLDKSMPSEALLHAVHLLALGGAVYPSTARPDIAVVRTTGAEGGPGAPLSQREAEILAGLLAGRSNKAIGRRLGISESTVKMHCKTLMRKIGAQNRTQAAVWALRHGIPAIRAAG